LITRLARKSLVIYIISWLALNSLVYASDPASSPVGWSDTAIGGGINLAVKEDGTVWSWGGNNYGQLGNGEFGQEKTSKSPVQVKNLIDVIAVAAGQTFSLALKKDGTVWAWGSNHYGNIGDGTKSEYDNKSGAILVNNDRHTPVQVPGLTDVKQIAADWVNSYAVKKDGTVWAWGEFYGTKPVQMTEWKQVASISVGYGSDLLVLKQDGTVWQMGTIDDSVYDGQNIPRQKTPKQVQGLSNIVAVANGAGCYFALQNDGSVWSWGINGNGQLGDGTNKDRYAPARIAGISDVVAITATAGGPLYLKRDGTVWGNGDNSGGQLGIGSYDDKNVPVQAKGLVKIKKIIATGINSRAMAIREDGILFSWGSGMTGDGTEWWSTTPKWIKSNDSEVLDSDPILVKLNGQGLYFDQPPIFINGRTMVPLRKIFESMGIAVTWDASTSTVTASKGNISAELSIDHQTAKVNGQSQQLDSAPVIVNGRTLVPVRFVAETFGAKVDWDQETKTVSISTSTTTSKTLVK
jgi:alpha-tubulin suppressor-like RCC1 family protein